MGKKIKKALGSVAKVATLGLVSEKNIGSVAGLLSGGLVGGPGGLLGGDASASADTGLADALAAQAKAAQNANVDLAVENVPTVDVGGSADAMASTGNATTRRRRGANTLSRSLGINVG